MIRETISKVVSGFNLTEDESFDAMQRIMGGKATSAQIASLITGLRMKGETIDEITGFAKAMRKKALKISAKRKNLVDTCGTGGDRLNTFNISTTSAFVVAGAGVAVAKHGNRSVSSKCGSADVLEELGINLQVGENVVAECINEIGIGFLFAPYFHHAMKFAAQPRKEIGIRTIFNILGPLTNPAEASAQVLGVYSENLTEIMANVLLNLGVKRAYIVCGLCGLDEISNISETKISELKDGGIKTYILKPEDVGIERTTEDSILGGDKKENSKILLDILQGKKGPKRDIVVLNAAAAIAASGLAETLFDGIKIAQESIDCEKALSKLELLREYTNA